MSTFDGRAIGRTASFTAQLCEVSQANLDLVLGAATTSPPEPMHTNRRRAEIRPGGRILVIISKRVFMGPEDRHGHISTYETLIEPKTDAELQELLDTLVRDRFDITWVGMSW